MRTRPLLTPGRRFAEDPERERRHHDPERGAERALARGIQGRRAQRVEQDDVGGDRES